MAGRIFEGEVLTDGIYMLAMELENIVRENCDGLIAKRQ